eukprot:180597_1
MNKSIPWKHILTNKVILSIFCVHFAYNWTFYLLLTQLPTYLSKKLNYNLSEAGFISFAPYIGQCIVSISMGIVTAKIIRSKYVSRSVVRKVCSSLSTVLPSALLVMCGYSNDVSFTILLLIIACSLMGFSSSGLLSNITDISQDYSSVIVGVSNTISTFPGILAPLLSGFILESYPDDGWIFIFYICLILSIIGSAMHWMYAHANPIPQLNIKSKSL